MESNITAIYGTETEFVHGTMAAHGRPPLVWSELCHCEQQRVLKLLSAERPNVHIREVV